MKAVVHKGGLGFNHLQMVLDFPDPQAKENEVVVDLKSAGLNHHDLFVLTGKHDETETPLIPGSDGAGIVSQVGTKVTQWRVGDEVIVNPLLWGTSVPVPPTNMEVLGYPRNGTLAQKVVLPENQLAKKPDYLNWTEAGVLALSALTAYRSVFTKGEVKAGQRVFVPGAGGAVATNMILMLKSAGAVVIVSSRETEKLAQARQLGADEFVLDTDNWQKMVEPVDLVIDDVGPATINRAMQLLKWGGRVVSFGTSSGDELTFDLRQFFFNQWTLKGSTGGTQKEFQKMLNLFEKHQWHPVVDEDVFTMKNVQQGYERMVAKKQFGNIAVKIEK